MVRDAKKGQSITTASRTVKKDEIAAHASPLTTEYNDVAIVYLWWVDVKEVV